MLFHKTDFKKCKINGKRHLIKLCKLLFYLKSCYKMHNLNASKQKNFNKVNIQKVVDDKKNHFYK